MLKDLETIHDTLLKDYKAVCFLLEQTLKFTLLISML